MIKARLFTQAKQGLGPLIRGILLRLCALVIKVGFLYLLATLLAWTIDQALLLLASIDSGAKGASLLLGAVQSNLDFALYSLVFVLIVAAYLLCQTLALRQCEKAGQLAKNELLKALFGKLVELGPSYESSVSSGKISFLMGEGIARIVSYVATYVPQLVYALAAPVILALVLFFMDAPVALLLLLCVPAMPVSIMMLMRKAKGLAGEQWDSYVDLSASFKDALAGMLTLKVFRADERKQEELAQEAEQFRLLTMKLLRMQLGNVVLMDACTYISIALAYCATLFQLAFGLIDVRIALFVLFMAPGFFLPMRKFGAAFHVGMNASEAIDGILAFLDIEPAASGVKTCLDAAPSIVFDQVDFSYGEHKALDGFSFSLNTNTLVGLTGASGSGKSSVAKLLSGQLVGYSGSIKINGTELRELDYSCLRSLVSVVSCESHVFKGSIRSNLALGKPDASDGEFWWALNRAHLDDFVVDLGGLDSLVLADGKNLSGGQCQRLCFARALLRDTPIYIFDEITANVDAESERFMAEAIQQMSFDKTILVISHRLADLVWADQINVMKDGRVVQSGSHAALVHQEGEYQKLWNISSELESFAAQAERVKDEIPVQTELERTMANMPQFAAMHMQAAIDTRALKRYEVGNKAASPSGHPAWIPLPDYLDAALEQNSAGNKGVESELAAEVSGAKGVEAELAVEVAGVKEDAHEFAAGKTGVKSASKFAADAASSKCAKPKHDARTYLRRLLNLTQACHKGLLAAVLYGVVGKLCAMGVVIFAALGVFAAVLAGPSDFMGELLAKVSPSLLQAPLALPVALALCFVCALLRGFVHYKERLLTHDQTFKTLAQIRIQIFEHLRSLAPARFAEKDASNLVLCVTSDIEELEGFYSKALALVASSFVTACLALLALAAVLMSAASSELNALVSAAAFLSIFLLALVAYLVELFAVPLLVSRREGKKAVEDRLRQGILNEFIEDSVKGFADLQLYERANEYAEEISCHLDEGISSGPEAYARSLRAAAPAAVSLVFCAAMALLVSFISSNGFALLVSGGGIGSFPSESVLAFANLALWMSTGAFFIFYAALSETEEVASLGTSLRRSVACAKEVLSVMDERPVVEEKPFAKEKFVAEEGRTPQTQQQTWEQSQQQSRELAQEELQDLAQRLASLGSEDYVLEIEDLSFSYSACPDSQDEDRASDLGQKTSSNKAEEALSQEVSSQEVLSQIDMALGAGVIVRVVGASGAGKSTLLKLIERFWDPSAGQIKILGKDIRELSLSNLRQILSYMNQDTYLFDASLRDNIALGNPLATDEEIFAALKKASALKIVQDLPDGLDTACAQIGFSSGERQRIGLARTLLYDAPIMLLDEPSSNLDSQTEAAILLALKKHCADKTIILVSHRPGSALIADATFVL